MFSLFQRRRQLPRSVTSSISPAGAYAARIASPLIAFAGPIAGRLVAPFITPARAIGAILSAAGPTISAWASNVAGVLSTSSISGSNSVQNPGSGDSDSNGSGPRSGSTFGSHYETGDSSSSSGYVTAGEDSDSEEYETADPGEDSDSEDSDSSSSEYETADPGEDSDSSEYATAHESSSAESIELCSDDSPPPVTSDATSSDQRSASSGSDPTSSTSGSDPTSSSSGSQGPTSSSLDSLQVHRSEDSYGPLPASDSSSDFWIGPPPQSSSSSGRQSPTSSSSDSVASVGSRTPLRLLFLTPRHWDSVASVSHLTSLLPVVPRTPSRSSSSSDDSLWGKDDDFVNPWGTIEPAPRGVQNPLDFSLTESLISDTDTGLDAFKFLTEELLLDGPRARQILQRLRRTHGIPATSGNLVGNFRLFFLSPD